MAWTVVPKQSVAWTVLSKHRHGQDCPCHAAQAKSPCHEKCGLGVSPKPVASASRRRLPRSVGVSADKEEAYALRVYLGATVLAGSELGAGA
ncbi:MAG: hypothetical protein NZ556_02250 [Fimbriimonadales bacterium]|nr:hypothetical protein [Fimbriimonadales bacterium]